MSPHPHGGSLRRGTQSPHLDRGSLKTGRVTSDRDSLRTRQYLTQTQISRGQAMFPLDLYSLRTGYVLSDLYSLRTHVPSEWIFLRTDCISLKTELTKHNGFSHKWDLCTPPSGSLGCTHILPRSPFVIL